MMQYMFAKGFLGTEAPFFMDTVTLLVALLPFFVYCGILIARKGHYDLHRWVQWSLFVVSLVVVGWFEYGARIGGGFQSFIKGSHLPKNLVLASLIVHILIAVVTLFLWIRTLVQADRNFREHNLPGGYTLRHIRAGMRTAIGIFLTSLSGIWVYLLLFVF